MNFLEALKILGIEKYGERIARSNSHGELFHISQYFTLAKIFGGAEWFPQWFDEIVREAEDTWERPESVFQHVHQILTSQLEEVRELRKSTKHKQ